MSPVEATLIMPNHDVSESFFLQKCFILTLLFGLSVSSLFISSSSQEVGTTGNPCLQDTKTGEKAKERE
jgi:hypothetical protein